MKLLNLGSFLLLFYSSILFANKYNFKLIKDDKVHFVGEEFKVEFKFSFKDDSKIAEVNFSPPIFHNLSIKDENKTNTKNSQSWIYTLIATDDKNVTIDNAYLDIAIKDKNKSLGNFDEYDYDYQSFETKPITLKIFKNKYKTKLFGDFSIKTILKKDFDAVKLTIKITGKGNFKDIGKYDLDIPNTTIYTDEPLISKNSFSQKFVIISDESFTIPSFKIVYIDSKTKKKVTKITKSLFVKVKKIEKKIYTNKKENKFFYLIYIFSGIIIGFLLSKLKFKGKNIEDKNLYEKIKQSKNTKEILQILISTNQPKYKNLIDKLEDDIYISKSNKLSKKEIIKNYLPNIN